MARRTLAQRLLGDELIEMRLMRLPLDARYVWEHLVELVGKRGTEGTLRLGSELGSELGFAGWFAHWFRRPETEMETHFETLLRAGLLFIQDGLLSLPGLSGAAARRAETARRNGSKGGRPPGSGRSAPPAQDALALRMPGGFAVVENPVETQADTESVDAQLASLETLSKRDELASCEAPPGYEADAAETLVAELFVLMEVPRSVERDLPQLVQGWLDRGVRPEQMRQVVRAERDKRRARGLDPVKTLGWFGERMVRLVAGPRPVVPSAAPAPQQAGPPVPSDPRVAHLSGAERSYAERALFNLAKMVAAGPLPDEPQVGSPSWQSLSFARAYCPPAYAAVRTIHPEVAGWFGDDVPGSQAAAG